MLDSLPLVDRARLRSHNSQDDARKINFLSWCIYICMHIRTYQQWYTFKLLKSAQCGIPVEMFYFILHDKSRSSSALIFLDPWLIPWLLDSVYLIETFPVIQSVVFLCSKSIFCPAPAQIFYYIFLPGQPGSGSLVDMHAFILLHR